MRVDISDGRPRLRNRFRIVLASASVCRWLLPPSRASEAFRRGLRGGRFRIVQSRQPGQRGIVCWFPSRGVDAYVQWRRFGGGVSSPGFFWRPSPTLITDALSRDGCTPGMCCVWPPGSVLPVLLGIGCGFPRRQRERNAADLEANLFSKYASTRVVR